MRTKIIFFFMIMCTKVMAQDEWLATLNYSNLSVNRIANIPGVTWVTADNSTYDENNQRFFFQGNANRTPPWYLYTVSAVTGAIINKPLCPSNMAGQVEGLQYDNGDDTLYALYSGGGSVSLSWIDPATGAVHIKKTLPGYNGYSWSTYDRKDHLYITSDGTSMLVINALTGAILYNPSLGNVLDIVYDNLNGKLFGIDQSASQFDSITLSTGALHPMAGLPSLSLPYLNAYTIDETSGRYIFLGMDLSSPTCISNYLYTLDINTGAVISKTLYPYAQSATVISDQNLIEYSFDNKRGILYALNWYPPVSPPVVTISADPNPPCSGEGVSFTATPATAATNPSFQWQLNGINVGTNADTYTNNDPAAGDSVRCILTNNPSCAVGLKDTSKAIGIGLALNASVSISSPNTSVCSGDTVLFTATPVNGGASSSFQWQINGVNTGSGKDTLQCTSLQNGDEVSCIMTVDSTCSIPYTSNKITAIIKNLPTVFAGNDTVILPGQSITIHPTISGSIVIYQWAPPTYLDNPNTANPVTSPVTTTTYQLTVTSDNGCTASGKIKIIVYRPLKMPNAFTPNGDGIDDVFRIPPQVATTTIKSFIVFNRWGQRIFYTNNSGVGWDGYFNGEGQPSGTYVWMIQYTDAVTNQSETASGTVVLIR
ncbi:MAG TPA: gliding motility-associated C-terminal domain-containing protein [Puia sp.]|nr:gliding motility-associated C-terminal domain-containing protein [Puia sp.]